MRCTPRLRRALASACAAALLAGCVQEPDAPGAPGAPLAVGDELQDVVAYARACKAAMGIPDDAPLAPMSCLEGVEVPTRVGGAPPSADTYAALAAGELGCDAPSWFPDLTCQNHNFVLHRALTDDVDAVLVCRSRGWSDPRDRAQRLADYEASGSVEDFEALYRFDTVGLIWHHRGTGDACFFDHSGDVYGGYVPSPDDPAAPTWAHLPDPKPPPAYAVGQPAAALWQGGARQRWGPPFAVAAFGGCVVCHDSGPWIRSPWLADLGVVPPHQPDLPYRPLGEAFLLWRELWPPVAVDTTPVASPDGATAPQLCTGCHRVGARHGCAVRLGYATGHELPPGTSEAGASLRARTTMPPGWHDGHADADLVEVWDALYGAHYDKLACCCEDPGALGCTRQDLMATPLAEPVPGAGPGSCEGPDPISPRSPISPPARGSP